MISIACEVISIKYGAVDNLIVCLHPGWAWPRRREIQILNSDLYANVYLAGKERFCSATTLVNKVYDNDMLCYLLVHWVKEKIISLDRFSGLID